MGMAMDSTLHWMYSRPKRVVKSAAQGLTTPMRISLPPKKMDLICFDYDLIDQIAGIVKYPMNRRH